MRYPAWKYLLIIIVLVISTLYALPSLYPDEPAVQISGAKAGTQIDQSIVQKAEQILKSESISSHDNSFSNNAALLRLDSSEAQLKAKEALRRGLGDDYVVALNLAPTTPEWLQKIGAKPMKLGLDLRGGVHFLLEVDMDKAIAQRMETSATDLRRQFRDNKIKFNSLALNNNTITVQFANNDDRTAAQDYLRSNGNEFNQQAVATATGSTLRLTYTDVRRQEIQSYAVNQNLTTLRNRINELGVAEALVQTQGSNRIVVELPGVQVFTGVFPQVQRDAGAALGAFDGFHFEVACAAADPAHAFICRRACATRLHGDLVGHDEAGVKAHAELPDQLGVGLLVAAELAHKVLGAALGDGAEVVDGFLRAHADAVVGDRQRLRVLVEGELHLQLGVALIQAAVVDGLEAQLVAGVRRVGDQLAQEDFLVRIQRMGHQVQQLGDFGLEGKGLLGHVADGKSESGKNNAPADRGVATEFKTRLSRLGLHLFDPAVHQSDRKSTRLNSSH